MHRLVLATDSDDLIFHVTLQSAHIWPLKKGLIHVNCYMLHRASLMFVCNIFLLFCKIRLIIKNNHLLPPSFKSYVTRTDTDTYRFFILKPVITINWFTGLNTTYVVGYYRSSWLGCLHNVRAKRSKVTVGSVEVDHSSAPNCSSTLPAVSSSSSQLFTGRRRNCCHDTQCP